MVVLKWKKMFHSISKNDVETQTDDMLQLQVNDDKNTNELFVLKTKWIKDTTQKIIEIHDFTLKMKDNKLKISSPNFQLAGNKFSIDCHVEQPGVEHHLLHDFCLLHHLTHRQGYSGHPGPQT